MKTMNKKPKILIADDEPQNRMLLRLFCEKWNYEVIEAENGKEAIEKAKEENPDVILMDIMMPIMDGFSSTKVLKSDPETEFIPVIMVTALDAREDRLKGIEAGADDFLTKPIDMEELKLRLRNTLKIKAYSDLLKGYNKQLEEEVAKRTEELRQSYIDTLYRLAKTAEYKDPETGNHIKRISHYSKELAQALGMDREFVEHVFYASPMHDIGKVGVPENILLKEGPLSPEEWEIMKKHTVIGGNILNGSKAPVIQMAKDIALFHHERWDGSGYPHKLSGEEIPLSARIVSIADVYDALRSKRPYKPALSHEEACRIIVEGDKRLKPYHFDPQILDLFKRIHRRLEDIYEELKDESTTPP